jgi:hypothetical protein
MEKTSSASGMERSAQRKNCGCEARTIAASKAVSESPVSFLAMRCVSSADEFKIFAEISRRLFQHRLRPAFAALLRDARIVARAVQAHAQVGAAFHADFAAAGIAGKRPGFAAVVAMSRHLNLRLADLRFTI